jgi:hypothetical protein
MPNCLIQSNGSVGSIVSIQSKRGFPTLLVPSPPSLVKVMRLQGELRICKFQLKANVVFKNDFEYFFRSEKWINRRKAFTTALGESFIAKTH